MDQIAFYGWLRGLASELVGAEADGFVLGDEDDLFELGLDEVGIAVLLGGIEHTWGVRLPDSTSVESVRTVHVLAEAVFEEAARRR